jgi:hypothetical protein
MAMRTFFLIVVCLLLLGCRRTTKQEQVSEEDLIAQSGLERIKIVDFDESSVLKYSEIFDNIRFVRLETNDSSLIGRIDKIVATEDKIVILDASIAKMVFVFDKNGNFLNRVGTNGGGAEEYDSPDDIVYDKYNNELLIWCHNKKTIMRFNLDGAFIDNIKTNWWASAISVIDKNTYLLYLNNVNQKNSLLDRCNILIIDGKGKILSAAFPSKDNDNLSPPARHVFSFYHDEVLFSPQYRRIIYKLNNDTIEGKYIIDFDKYNIQPLLLNDITFRELNKKMKNSEYVFNINSLETEKHVICQFVYKQKIFDCFYCKKTKAIKTSSIFFNDMYALSPNRSVNYVCGDSIISYIEPSSFIQFQYIENEIKRGKKINELLIRKFTLPTFLGSDKLNQNFESAITSSNIKLTMEEFDFINSINEMDNPIVRISSLKEF